MIITLAKAKVEANYILFKIISVQKGSAISYRSWQLNEDRKFFIEENIRILEENNNGK